MNKNTAERLYEYRRANHFSQEELAEKIGVSRQAISKWERGESSPDTDNLIALARLYNISIDELINGEATPAQTVINDEKENTNDTEYSEYSYGTAEDDAESQNTHKSGANFNNGKDSVHIGFDGIHIETEKDSVHIGPDDIGARGRRKAPRNPFIHAVLPLVCVVVYLILGFTTSMGWAYGWLLFLLIPIAESLYSAIQTKNPSAFCYPVFVVFLYLAIGFMFHVWHPTWILFITIPVFYVMCDSIKKTRAEKYSEENYTQTAYQNNGTYYTPNVDETKPHKKSKSGVTAIIMTAICAIMVIIVVAISCVFGFLNRLGINDMVEDFASWIPYVASDEYYDNYDEARYSVGNAEIDADMVQNIDIEWISGNVDIEYYDGDTISLSENEQSDENHKLRYKLDNGTLDIKYIKSGVLKRRNGNLNLSKELTIYIPKDKVINNIDVESVSAGINSEITVGDFDAETVSGNIIADGIMNSADAETVSGNITFICPQSFYELSTDSVSGETQIIIPKDISGFYVTASSVSGRINADDFNISGKALDYTYGAGGPEISFNSVSGSLNIKGQ